MDSSSLGLVVTAKQHHYPIELSNLELLSHYETIQDYHNELSNNMILKNFKFKPDLKLILQQPEMYPLENFRSSILNFLFQVSLKTKVTTGIFHASCRLYDRYCSKRIVLQDQAKLVILTCLWVTAKTYGGCNHIINNVSVPTGGRFYGPNPRARVLRLNELIHYCGGYEKYDESMFIQMEKHILDTLQWDIMEPMLNDYVLNVDENCLIQYELYQRQLNFNSTNNGEDDVDDDDEEDSDDIDEDKDLNDKIQLIHVKKFLIDLSCWQLDFLQYEFFEISHGIFKLINTILPPKQHIQTNPHTSILLTPQVNELQANKIKNILLNTIVNKKMPLPLIQYHSKNTKILNFISKCVTEYSIINIQANSPSANIYNNQSLSMHSKSTSISSSASSPHNHNNHNNNNNNSNNQNNNNNNNTSNNCNIIHNTPLSNKDMPQTLPIAYATPPNSRTASRTASAVGQFSNINGSCSTLGMNSLNNINTNSAHSNSTNSSSADNTPYIIQGKTFVPLNSTNNASSNLQQQQPSPITPGIDGLLKKNAALLVQNGRFQSSLNTTVTSATASANATHNNNNNGVMGIGLIHHRS